MRKPFDLLHFPNNLELTQAIKAFEKLLLNCNCNKIPVDYIEIIFMSLMPI